MSGFSRTAGFRLSTTDIDILCHEGVVVSKDRAPTGDLGLATRDSRLATPSAVLDRAAERAQEGDQDLFLFGAEVQRPDFGIEVRV